jgi:hypothetical protein
MAPGENAKERARTDCLVVFGVTSLKLLFIHRQKPSLERLPLPTSA